MTLKVPLDQTQSGLATVGTPLRFVAKKAVDVPQIALDLTGTALIKRAPHVVKIDVEGAELDVLRGAEAFLNEHKPLLVIEVDPRNTAQCGYTPEDVYALLKRWGVEYVSHGADVWGYWPGGGVSHAEFVLGTQTLARS